MNNRGEKAQLISFLYSIEGRVHMYVDMHVSVDSGAKG
jgi:hypothetical protein